MEADLRGDQKAWCRRWAGLWLTCRKPIGGLLAPDSERN